MFTRTMSRMLPQRGFADLTSTELDETDPDYYPSLHRAFDAPVIEGMILKRSGISRRGVLGAALGAAALTLTAPSIVRASTSGRIGRDRLWLINASNGETINQPFLFRDPAAHRRAWAAYSYFWRDWRDQNKGVWIDRRMLGAMADIQMELSRRAGQEVPLMLNSGYRTPQRNATIRGAARNSFHIYGRASDFWARGMAHSTVQLVSGSTAGVGGMGRYAGFTHIDTGPARRWG